MFKSELINNKELYKTESSSKIYESTLYHTREFWKRRGFQWSDTEYEGKYFHYNNGVDRKMDNYYDMMKDRINRLEGEDLPDDWDGVYRATTK